MWTPQLGSACSSKEKALGKRRAYSIQRPPHTGQRVKKECPIRVTTVRSDPALVFLCLKVPISVANSAQSRLIIIWSYTLIIYAVGSWYLIPSFVTVGCHRTTTSVLAWSPSHGLVFFPWLAQSDSSANGHYTKSSHSMSPITKYLNFLIIFMGADNLPPATPLNYVPRVPICYVFNYFIRRRHFGWWSKYNLSTSLCVS